MGVVVVVVGVDYGGVGVGLATAVALLVVKARVVGAVECGCGGIGRVCRCSSGTQGECI